MSKQFFLPEDQIKPLATGHGPCIASDMITVEGHKVGHMYRDPPDGGTSGWVFLVGAVRLILR